MSVHILEKGSLFTSFVINPTHAWVKDLGTVSVSTARTHYKELLTQGYTAHVSKPVSRPLMSNHQVSMMAHRHIK